MAEINGTCSACALGPCPLSAMKCEGLDDDILLLSDIGVEEGTYDPETMMWVDHTGAGHSQRCNARKLAENGNQAADAPEHY